MMLINTNKISKLLESIGKIPNDKLLIITIFWMVVVILIIVLKLSN